MKNVLGTKFEALLCLKKIKWDNLEMQQQNYQNMSKSACRIRFFVVEDSLKIKNR